jgi:5'-nucleotidase
MSSNALPRVVITNDDGIDAPGLAALLDALEGLAECRVVAPDGPRSGVGHALTDDGAVRVRPAERGLAVGGTPADCARLALSPSTPLLEAWRAARRERAVWLVSGINHGANLGMDTYVSGTAAAAREATILGFPALAISQYVGRHRKPDWERAVLRARPVLAKLLARPPRTHSYWNVNLPHPADEDTACEVVHCAPDPSPHAVRYEARGEVFTYAGDFHTRPRLPGHDVDVCFGGRIAVSEITLAGVAHPVSPDPERE